MSRSTVVLTIIGEDRPGLVGLLSQTVAELGGNWEESRMARLGGRFAGILLVGIEPERVDALVDGLQALAGQGVRVTVEPGGEGGVPEGHRRLRVSLLGQDRTGIIRDISTALASRDVNVESLETQCEEAPMGGGELFRMVAEISVPPSLATGVLRTTLENLGNDLMVDIALRDDVE